MKALTLLAAAGLGLGLLALAPTSLAHHSTNSIYDESRTVEVTGKVLVWRLVNPHPYLTVEVTGADGEAQEWDVSFGGSAAAPLRRQGYTPESFTPGETVIVRGNPAWSESFRGILVRGGITREDGTRIP